MPPTATIRTRKFMLNRLLCRKQFVVDVIHQERANVAKTELKGMIAKMYNVTDPNCIVLYGFKTQYGGGRSSGFGMIYDNIKKMQQFEPKYRLMRVGMITKTQTNRKQRKERKNKAKRTWGVRGKVKKAKEDK